MKSKRFNESHIFKLLKEAEAGSRVPELCRKYGMSSASFCKWRAKYWDMDTTSILTEGDTAMMNRMKQVEQEDARLKRMYAEEKCKAQIVMEALEKSVKPISSKGAGSKVSQGSRREYRPACQAFASSETYYRYQAKFSGDNC